MSTYLDADDILASDMFDTRDLRDLLDEVTIAMREADDPVEKAEAAAELVALEQIWNALEDLGEELRYGVAVISDGYFEEYARSFAEDIGAIDREAAWPCCHIDWEAAAASLQQDYLCIEMPDGSTWWARA